MDDGRDREQDDQQISGAEVRADSQSVPRETYLLTTGAPGAIIDAMINAQRLTGEDCALLNDGEGVAATAAFNVARKVLTESGVCLMYTASGIETVERPTQRGTQPFTTMIMSMRFIARDGSYIGHVFPAGGSASNNKNVQAAVTSGVKTALMKVLMMSVETNQERADRPVRVSAALLAYIKDIHRCEDPEQLRTVNKLPSFDALKPGDLARARAEWRERSDQIDRIVGSGWRAKEIRDEQTARANKREKDAADASRVEAQSPHRGKAIDMSATRPATEKDRRGR